MRKILTLGAALVAFATVAASAPAADPIAAPFPSTTSGPVFIAAQTVTCDRRDAEPVRTRLERHLPRLRGRLEDRTRCSSAKDVKYFYVTIPNQPNVKLTYQPKAPGATGRMVWIGHLDGSGRPIPTGLVNFKVLVKTESKRIGQFVQMPVATCAADDRREPADDARRRAGGDGGSRRCPTRPSRSTWTPSTAPSRSERPSAPSAARRRTSTSAASRSSSACGASTSRPGTTLSTDNVDTATYSIPGQADRTGHLRRPRCRRRQGVLLVRPVDRSAHLPAR